MTIAFLFCSNYFDKSKPDEDYKTEYECAIKSGKKVFLFNLEDFLERQKIYLPTTIIPITLIYRGWMLTCDQYHMLYNSLKNIGYCMINSPLQYRQCHHLPYWYETLKGNTPKSVWTKKAPTKDEIIELLKYFNETPLIVKDYVKSRKHEWDKACFVPNAKDTTKAMDVINNFILGQGDGLVGGIVLREFLSLKIIGNHEKSNMPIAKEVRVFCFKNKPFAYIEYWSGSETYNISEYENLIKKTNCLNSNFYTVDLAQKTNGQWVIIEVGDAQVSGLQDYNPILFYDNLKLIES